jgi:hypothetical protein
MAHRVQQHPMKKQVQVSLASFLLNRMPAKASGAPCAAGQRPKIGHAQHLTDSQISCLRIFTVRQSVGSIDGEGFELREAFGARQVPPLGRVTRPQHLFHSREVGRRPL